MKIRYALDPISTLICIGVLVMMLFFLYYGSADIMEYGLYKHNRLKWSPGFAKIVILTCGAILGIFIFLSLFAAILTSFKEFYIVLNSNAIIFPYGIFFRKQLVVQNFEIVSVKRCSLNYVEFLNINTKSKTYALHKSYMEAEEFEKLYAKLLHVVALNK